MKKILFVFPAVALLAIGCSSPKQPDNSQLPATPGAITPRGINSPPAIPSPAPTPSAPTPTPTPTSTPLNPNSPQASKLDISGCQEITKLGAYFLSNDIVSPLGASCIKIHDVSGVQLTCNNHKITANVGGNINESAVKIVNAKNITVAGCIMDEVVDVSSNPSLAGAGQVLEISGSSHGILKDNKFSEGFIAVAKSDHMEFSNNSFFSTLQFHYDTYAQINNNTFTPTLASFNAYPGADIGLDNGSNNTISGNTIDGASSGFFPDDTSKKNIGVDDGITVEDESGDTVQSNTIKNVYDAGIENMGFMDSTVISGNKITNAGTCGIGGWYYSSLKGDTIKNNVISNTPLAFMYLRFYGLRKSDLKIYFQGNMFDGNIFTNPRSALDYAGKFSINLDSIMPGGNDVRPATVDDFVLGGNIFTNNDFSVAARAPYFKPISAFVNGGGNKCGEITDPGFQFNCSQ